MKKRMVYFQDKLDFEIDSADLFAMISSGTEVIIVDARKSTAFNNEHIPGAINLPHGEINESSIKQLNKDKLYVTYCDGIGCNASTKGAFNLAALGFNVKELIGGIDWWKRDGYTTSSRKTQEDINAQCTC